MKTKKKSAPLPRIMAPLDSLQRYSIEEAAAYLRISRATLYVKIAAGELTPLREGARTFIPGSEIIRRSTLANAS